ncbi:DJ-1/PfpI family protein [Prolixibacteraceae bacterium]|nr:DJ-1/PfpI family protein [Prolixibacteraceae bacterium]
MKRVVVLLFNGYSDWEIAFLTPELQKNKKIELLYASLEGRDITSRGGIHVNITTSIKEIPIQDISMLILPGGTYWEGNIDPYIQQLISNLYQLNRTIAAICGATIPLAQAGILNTVVHTSNMHEYLKQFAPNYSGYDRYLNELCVSANCIITSSGIAPIEFAKSVFLALGVMDKESGEKWYQLFKNGIWQA